MVGRRAPPGGVHRRGGTARAAKDVDRYQAVIVGVRVRLPVASRRQAVRQTSFPPAPAAADLVFLQRPPRRVGHAEGHPAGEGSTGPDGPGPRQGPRDLRRSPGPRRQRLPGQGHGQEELGDWRNPEQVQPGPTKWPTQLRAASGAPPPEVPVSPDDRHGPMSPARPGQPGGGHGVMHPSGSAPSLPSLVRPGARRRGQSGSAEDRRTGNRRGSRHRGPVPFGCVTSGGPAICLAPSASL